MNIKFDDGEHCNIVPADALKGYMPEIGHVISWESEPETEDELAKGQYRVTKVEWTLGSKVKALVTVSLERK